MRFYNTSTNLPKVVDAFYTRHETLFLHSVQMPFYDYFLERGPKGSIERGYQ